MRVTGFEWNFAGSRGYALQFNIEVSHELPAGYDYWENLARRLVSIGNGRDVPDLLIETPYAPIYTQYGRYNFMFIATGSFEVMMEVADVYTDLAQNRQYPRLSIVRDEIRALSHGSTPPFNVNHATEHTTLTGVTISNTGYYQGVKPTYKEVTFKGCDMVNLRNTTFVDCTFEGCTFSGGMIMGVLFLGETTIKHCPNFTLYGSGKDVQFCICMPWLHLSQRGNMSAYYLGGKNDHLTVLRSISTNLTLAESDKDVIEYYIRYNVLVARV